MHGRGMCQWGNINSTNLLFPCILLRLAPLAWQLASTLELLILGSPDDGLANLRLRLLATEVQELLAKVLEACAAPA